MGGKWEIAGLRDLVGYQWEISGPKICVGLGGR